MSRQSADRRKITNFNVAKEKLLQNNFQIIEPENISMQEEICLCSQANIIAGVQGSNLEGIIFSSESIVIEFSPVYIPIFHMMANELDLDYFSIYNEQIQSKGNVHKNVKFPIKMFEKILLDAERLL
jgi:capsular polysaccharide biosynthesis protein